MSFRRSVYHCGVLAACSRQKLKIFKKFLHFLEKRPLIIKILKFCSESLHHDTDRRCWVQNSWKLSDGKSVKSCVIYLTKKKQNKISAPSPTDVKSSFVSDTRAHIRAHLAQLLQCSCITVSHVTTDKLQGVSNAAARVTDTSSSKVCCDCPMIESKFFRWCLVSLSLCTARQTHPPNFFHCKIRVT